MALAISINGGDITPITDVVLYDETTPIAAAISHGSIVIYADSIRDPNELGTMLESLGVTTVQARPSGVVIKGNVGR